ncbi:hypothetical protein B0T16DRAFT_506327 [Cercophora newfieldiana]|uniref:Uncharacterized protein n=1 Tax=Cercophora newfieldiana TaxID=92897 RepID=A0AA39Y8T2_9PEZI|nr:hypothetical protein B0T16DRAFT_506327 [Cercophora newfieldiana]
MASQKSSLSPIQKAIAVVRAHVNVDWQRPDWLLVEEYVALHYPVGIPDKIDFNVVFGYLAADSDNLTAEHEIVKILVSALHVNRSRPGGFSPESGLESWREAAKTNKIPVDLSREIVFFLSLIRFTHCNRPSTEYGREIWDELQSLIGRHKLQWACEVDEPYQLHDIDRFWQGADFNDPAWRADCLEPAFPGLQRLTPDDHGVDMNKILSQKYVLERMCQWEAQQKAARVIREAVIAPSALRMLDSKKEKARLEYSRAEETKVWCRLGSLFNPVPPRTLKDEQMVIKVEPVAPEDDVNPTSPAGPLELIPTPITPGTANDTLTARFNALNGRIDTLKRARDAEMAQLNARLDTAASRHAKEAAVLQNQILAGKSQAALTDHPSVWAQLKRVDEMWLTEFSVVRGLIDGVEERVSRPFARRWNSRWTSQEKLVSIDEGGNGLGGLGLKRMREFERQSALSREKRREK